MKTMRMACISLALLCLCVGAEAAKEPEYTLSVKNNTVLQDEADRGIAVQAAGEPRAVIPGESPITGLPWEGEYLPLLVQIGNDVGYARANGYEVKSAGIGNRTPWGIQYADILYEELVYSTGYTRFTALFSDSLAQGEPAMGVGPVRSCRIGPVLLSMQWRCGLIYAGRFAGETWERLLAEIQDTQAGVLLDAHQDYAGMGYPVQGVKRPNYNAYVVQNRSLILDTFTSTPHPFLFQEGGAYGGANPAADTINLDWGYKYQISHFVYDAQEGVYARYCGAGIDPKKWVLFTAFATVEDREDADRAPMDFANVIVQRVSYTWEDGSALKPIPKLVGQGNADIFIDGRYIPGYWVCEAQDAPTVYTDDQGNEIRLNRGKTYVAYFPDEARLTFTGGE